MSATTATNSLTSTQQREREKQQRERQRGLQFQDNSVSFLPIANGNVHFSGPIKHEYEDATAKRIKDTLGEFNQKDYIVSNHKQLAGISTNRTKIINANKAKIEQIFSEMKNNIQPLTGLEDNEIADITEESSSTNHHNSVNNNSNVNNVQPPPPLVSQTDSHHLDRKESSGKLKELNLNSSSNKHVNNSSASKDHHNNQTNKSSSTNHSSLINYTEHSDQDLLDEVSDESPSSNNKSKQIANSQQSNQLPTNKPIHLNKALHKRAPDQQDENLPINEDVQSDDSSRRRRKTEPLVINDSIIHHNTDHLNKKQHMVEEESVDGMSVSSYSDSDSSSGSSESSSSDDNLSDSDSLSSSIVRKGGHSKASSIKSKQTETTNDPNSANKNSNNLKDSLTAAVVSNSQQPRSWALSSFCNNHTNNDKLSSLKSPPVTKAQLKQTIIPNENQDKVTNAIESVVKSKAEQANKTVNKQINYESDDQSSVSSSSSKLSKKIDCLVHKNKSTKSKPDHSTSKLENKRTKRSLSPIKEACSDIERPPSKASKKSYSSSIHKSKEPSNKYSSDKEEDKFDKNIRNHHSPIPPHNNSSTLIKDSSKDKHTQSPSVGKRENTKSSKLINKELPKNLLVSIDLSTLDKKKLSSKKDNEKVKSSSSNKSAISSRDVAKENLNKKDIDYKDKYRSSDKKASKDKHSSKNDKLGKYEKYDKTDNKYDKGEKADKYEKTEKKSKKSKEDDKSKEDNKRSAKVDEQSSKESKHKKLKKEFNKKEDRLKESIKNELFDKPVRSNETTSSASSSKLHKDSSKSAASLLEKESNRESNKESDRDTTKDTPSSKDSSTFKEPPVAQKASTNHHSKDDIDYQKEGTRWKHTGDREKDPIKQYCKYLEAALYFLQFARRFERTNDAQDKIKALYNNTLTFLRSALHNKFAKSRPHSSNENRLSVLGLRLLSLTIFHINKLVMKDMRSYERNIRSNLASAAKLEDADPSKPDQPLIVSNKMQLSIHLFSAMKKQLDYLSLYNELTELWQQSEHILDGDTNSNAFFKKLNAECGQLCLNSNVDDLVPYVKTGLKLLNIDYS